MTTGPALIVRMEEHDCNGTKDNGAAMAAGKSNSIGQEEAPSEAKGSPPKPMTPGEFLDAYLVLTPERQVRVQDQHHL